MRHWEESSGQAVYVRVEGCSGWWDGRGHTRRCIPACCCRRKCNRGVYIGGWVANAPRRGSRFVALRSFRYYVCVCARDCVRTRGGGCYSYQSALPAASVFRPSLLLGPLGVARSGIAQGFLGACAGLASGSIWPRSLCARAGFALGPIWGRSGLALASIWTRSVEFRMGFLRVWSGFALDTIWAWSGLVLGSFWARFGVVLGSFWFLSALAIGSLCWALFEFNVIRYDYHHSTM